MGLSCSTMKVWCAVLFVCLAVQGAVAAGSGRAFPVASENYAISSFQSINPSIEWDRTNFMVDLAGLYANCDWASYSGLRQIDSTTDSGEPISAIIDNTYGSGMDVDSVNMYIKQILDEWVRGYHPDYQDLISGADIFGCSVRPGCSGYVVVACLFPLKDAGEQGNKPLALAFTSDQYKVAERITENRWDRSFYLENLSGTETDCAMVHQSQWSFAKAIDEASKRGEIVVGQHGYAENRGETQPAMKEILYSFKNIYAKAIGCSVIPDCTENRGDIGKMYVVVSCLYEES